MKNCYAMIRKDRINKKGESPILVRIVVDNQSTYISTGLKIKPDQWNEKKQLPKNTFPNSTAAKHLIENYINKVKGIFYDLDRTNKRKSSKDIKDMVVNNNSDSLIHYIKNWIDDRKARKEITHSTHLKYSGIVDKLEKTFGKTIKISDFDVNFLKVYDHALRTKFKNGTNTIASNFSFLRAVSNALIQDDKMELNSYPFRMWKLKFEEVKRKYLSPEQIKSIEQIILPNGSKIDLSRKIFLFCNQEGFRIGDALRMKVKDFTGTHFVFESQKTKTFTNILVTKKALKIIEPLIAGKSKNDYIFDFLLDKKQPESEALREQNIATSLINKNLNIIGKRCGFDFKISSHFARHSFATNALSNGSSIEEIKSLLHHKDIKTTQIYAKAVDAMKDAAMKKIG